MEELLITSIRSYKIASLVFTTSMMVIITSFITYLVINLSRLIFRFNHKAEYHFLKINRAIGITAAVFLAFMIMSVILNHFNH